jgi:hypothetical protein
LAHQNRRERIESNCGRMRIFPPVLTLVVLSVPACVSARQAPASGPGAVPSAQNPQAAGTSTSSSSTNKKKPIPSFLIIGTVFNEKAFSFPGVQVQIRQVGEKKFRWETSTNSRGEFAVRVPPGHEYEVVTHVKNYQDQSQKVDSKVDVQQRLSIKLEPWSRTKTGAKL